MRFPLFGRMYKAVSVDESGPRGYFLLQVHRTIVVHPRQILRERVNLIVEATIWESENFRNEVL